MDTVKRMGTTILALSAFLALIFLPGQPPAEAAFSKAKYRGKPGCPGGSFFDPRKGGECWSCPRGQKRTIFPVTGDKACEVPLHESLKKAKYHKRTGCRGKRQFFDPRKGGECWSCPKGYGRSVFSVTSNKACAKGLRFKRAKYHHKSGCTRGTFFDPRKGGQCWSCPRGYRRTAYAVTSSKACSKPIPVKRTRARFVRKGGICASGQFLDLRKGGECWSCPKNWHRSLYPVTSTKACSDSIGSILSSSVCTATIDAIKAGRKIVGFGKVLSTSISRTNRLKGKYRNKSEKNCLMARMEKYLGPYKHVVPELKRIAAVMKRNHRRLKRLFLDSKFFCDTSGPQKDRKLISLGLRPKFPHRKSGLMERLFVKKAYASSDDHFYMGYQIGVAGGAGFGGQLAISVVTDYRGKGGGFISLGPQYVTNVAAGASFGLQFYPKTNIKEFEGWGWGVGVSGGPPTKIVAGGVDFSFDPLFKKFQGFGINLSIGAGVLPGDLAFAFAHTWKMGIWGTR